MVFACGRVSVGTPARHWYDSIHPVLPSDKTVLCAEGRIFAKAQVGWVGGTVRLLRLRIRRTPPRPWLSANLVYLRSYEKVWAGAGVDSVIRVIIGAFSVISVIRRDKSVIRVIICVLSVISVILCVLSEI